jgi:hypothetical protein
MGARSPPPQDYEGQLTLQILKEERKKGSKKLRKREKDERKR